MAAWRETKTLKPIEKAIGRMVSESPGRNVSERRGGPEKLKPRRPSLTVERRRQHALSHLADAATHSGCARATTEHWFDPCDLLRGDARSELREEYRRRQKGGGWEHDDADFRG